LISNLPPYLIKKKMKMNSNKYINFRKVVYYYWSDIQENNNKYGKNTYRSLVIKTDYLDDNQLKERENIINKFKNVLCMIDELKYLPPTKIGRLLYQGGYLYNEHKNNFENNFK